MVYDDLREVLYITSGGSVLRYSLVSGDFLSSFDLGGDLAGIDISPNGKTLAVADRTRTDTNVWIHLINLETGNAGKILFPRASGEGGTFAVAFGSDGNLLITATFEGSGSVPLRRYNPANGVTVELATIRQNSMVTSSSDRNFIGFEESNVSDGRFGRYRVSDGTLIRKEGYTDGTAWFNYEIGVNRNGTQYALPTYGGCFITDASLVKQKTLGEYAGPQPIGVVYSPLEDIVYFAWATTTEVRAFDTNTFEQIAAYDFEHEFKHTGNQAFDQGRLRISKDGTLLFATVEGGVRYIRIDIILTTSDQVVSVNKNSSTPITLTASGARGPLVFTIESGPTNGSLTGELPNLIYRPERSYTGQDGFTFKVSDGKSEVTGTVTLNVLGNNNAPIALNRNLTIREDQPITVALYGQDPDNDPVTYHIMEDPRHGHLNGEGSQVVYVPELNYSGADSFKFRMSDGQADSNTATISFTITPVNDAPEADTLAVELIEDTSKKITLTGRDVEGDPLTFILVSNPAHGALTGSGAEVTYRPASNYTGHDSFTYKVNDGKLDSYVATVSITVSPDNRNPVAVNDAASTKKKKSVLIAVLANDSDADGDSLSLSSLTQASKGTVEMVGSQVKYTPNMKFNGTDVFTYTVRDSRGGEATASVTVTVTKK
jgi:hypothetical protein